MTFRTLKKRFQEQKTQAKRRGIAFELTFLDWLKIWENSGHLGKRGCRLGQYVMARHRDAGPYAVDNVRIITCSANHAEIHPNLRRKRRAQAKETACPEQF